MSASQWRVGVLGAVTVRPAPAGQSLPGQARSLLALLASRHGYLVTTEEVIDAFWPDSAVRSARNRVQSIIALLRKRLSEDEIVTEYAGYRLAATADATLFEAAKSSDRIDVLESALALWRGPAYHDVALPAVTSEAKRLNELRLDTVEKLAGLRLARGEHALVLPLLQSLVPEHPLRQHLRGQLMVALYRCGRQAEALEVYRLGAAELAAQHGLDPSEELRLLHERILRDDPTVTAFPEGGVAVVGTHKKPCMLPQRVALFTGRGPLLESLDAFAAGGGGLAIITGAPGMGKTALAVQWAHGARDRFPDGQLFVDLRGFASAPPLLPIEALSRLLFSLGVAPNQIPSEVDDATAMLRDHTADRRVLLLLDNAASPEQVRPLIPAGEGCLALVTSRHRLTGLVARDGGHALPVDGLSDADGLRLLQRILGPETAAEPEALELVRLCAHVPMALRIAAANLAGPPRIPVADYVARLRDGDRLGALEVEGDSAAAVRPQFALSLRALSPAAKRLLGLLGLVPGPDVTTDAAAVLLGSDADAEVTADAGAGQVNRCGDTAGSLLRQLAAVHLATERAPGRYGQHDLLKLFAASLAGPEGATALSRLYHFYLDRVDAAARVAYPQVLRLPREAGQPHYFSPGAALSWLDDERPNLVQAIISAPLGDPSVVLLADSLRGYFFLRPFWTDWCLVADAALAAAQRQAWVAGLASAYLNLADLYWRRGDHGRAIDAYDRARTHALQAEWPEAAATVEGNLGNVLRISGRLDEAASHLREALRLNRPTGRLAGQAVVLANLATVNAERGLVHEALENCSESLVLMRKLGAAAGEAVALTNLGDWSNRLNRTQDALGYLEKALAAHRELHDPAGEAETLRCLAEVRLASGATAVAQSLAEQALRAAERSGDPRVGSGVHHTLARLHHARGEHAEALRQHEISVAQACSAGHAYVEAQALAGQAAAYHALGRGREATACASRALELARRNGYRAIEAELTARAAAQR